MLKALMHPDHTGRCLDPECSVRDCLGNRIVVGEDEGDGMIIHVCHEKTERWGRKDVEYTIPVPAGQVADLLRLHIEVGQAILADYEGHSADRLFRVPLVHGESLRTPTASLHRVDPSARVCSPSIASEISAPILQLCVLSSLNFHFLVSTKTC
eukprot:gene28574-31733_t